MGKSFAAESGSVSPAAAIAARRQLFSWCAASASEPGCARPLLSLQLSFAPDMRRAGAILLSLDVAAPSADFYRCEARGAQRGILRIRIAINRRGGLQPDSPMATLPPTSASKVLIGASVFFLSLTAVFGVLNANKTRALRAEVMQSEAVREDALRRAAQQQKQTKARDGASVSVQPQTGSDQTKAAEAELIKMQTDKQQLQAKLRDNEAELAELRKRVEASSSTVSAAPPAGPSTQDLQTELAAAKKQVEAAESEKSLLADKMQTSQQRPPKADTESKRRVVTTRNPGIRGTVLAVNQAYNFVVLNLGGRQGIEANSEMLVLRGGTLIGKIRISSVEPATAIGDIMSTTLARGVQVQPGDTVIYAGSNS
jgi:hypothetical protein